MWLWTSGWCVECEEERSMLQSNGRETNGGESNDRLDEKIRHNFFEWDVQFLLVGHLLDTKIRQHIWVFKKEARLVKEWTDSVIIHAQMDPFVFCPSLRVVQRIIPTCSFVLVFSSFTLTILNFLLPVSMKLTIHSKMVNQFFFVVWLFLRCFYLFLYLLCLRRNLLITRKINQYLEM